MIPELELCVSDAAGVAVAAAVGAVRVELCSALALGGLTPSAGSIAAAVDAAQAAHDGSADAPVEVHVLVRPRAGDFGYAPAEQAVALADVAAAVAAGATGVVVGATAGAITGATVDAAFVRSAVDAAAGAPVTFHRAFDTLADRRSALDVLIAAGVARVLTSGGATRAVDALAELAALVVAARGAIEVMAGGGIDAATVGRVAATGVPAVHASVKRTVTTHVPVALGSAAGAGTVTHEQTDPVAARALRAALDAEAG